MNCLEKHIFYKQQFMDRRVKEDVPDKIQNITIYTATTDL